MLKDSLGGNSKTMMIANIWPEAAHFEETASTLRFAERMKGVENEVSKNIHFDPQLQLRKYERQIKELQQELRMHDTLVGRGNIRYDEYDEKDKEELKTTVKRYIDGEQGEIE